MNIFQKNFKLILFNLILKIQNRTRIGLFCLQFVGLMLFVFEIEEFVKFAVFEFEDVDEITILAFLKLSFYFIVNRHW